MTSEKIFKWVCFALLGILIFCLKGFLNFRSFCEAKGYYFFPSDSLVWCGVGFCSIFVQIWSHLDNQVHLLCHHEEAYWENHTLAVYRRREDQKERDGLETELRYCFLQPDHDNGLYPVQKLILVPINCWRQGVLLSDLQGISELAFH